jgi:hypothetical protein
MKTYYVSRILISVAFGILQLATGTVWWKALLIVLGLIALFMWAPHCGRYTVYPEFGVSALRRDEYTQTINDKAARNAFVAMVLILCSILFITGAAATISVGMVKWSLVGGVGIYYFSDFWLRRQNQGAKPTEL